MKKLFSFLILLMFFWNLSTDSGLLYSQSTDAFDITILPLRDKRGYKINYIHFFHHKDYTYFSGGAYSRPLLVRNEINGEIELYDDDLVVGKFIRQPYSDKILATLPFTSYIGNFLVLTDGTIDSLQFGNRKNVHDSTYQFCGVGYFPRKEWEEHYTVEDACLYYVLGHEVLDVPTLDWIHVKNTLVKISSLHKDRSVSYEIEIPDSVITPWINPKDPWKKKWTVTYEINRTMNNTEGIVAIPDSTIWFAANPKSIVRYDEKTGNFTGWNIDTIMSKLIGKTAPIDIDEMESIYLIKDNDNYKNSKVCFSLGINHGFLIFENGQWKLEKIDFSNSEIFTTYFEDSAFQIDPKPLNWAKNEVAFSVYHTKNGLDLKKQSLFARTLIIYNYKTKKARDFVIPAEAFGDEEFVLTEPDSVLYKNKTKNIYTHCVQELEDGRKAMLISPAEGNSSYYKYNGIYVVYNPEKDTSSGILNGSESEIETRLPTLCFKTLYPNPSKSQISAEIWCYLADISKLRLCLYDSMGKEVMDLSNKLKYNASTSILSVDFEIPDMLPKGSYFLTIRSNKETRSKGIILLK